MITEHTDRENKTARFLAWLLIGIVIAFIVSACTMTGKFSIRAPFYDCGEVSDVSVSRFRRDRVEDTGYQEASGKVVLEKGSFSYTISVEGYKSEWQYLCVQIEDLTEKSLKWTVIYENTSDGKIKGSAARGYDLSEGINILELPEQSFNKLELQINGEDGCSFKIGSMQFRENLPVFSIGTIVQMTLLSFAVYAVISGILLLICRRLKIKISLYFGIEILQELYLSIIKRLQRVFDKLPVIKKYRRPIRTLLFFTICVISVYGTVTREYYTHYKYVVAILILLILAIAFLSLEGQASKRNWNNPLVWSWIILCALACISDFIIPKESEYSYFYLIGYVIVLFLGFFIFIWNNMKNPGELTEDLVRAIHLFFCVMTVYCLIFRPETEGERYTGFCHVSTIFAVYLGIIFAVIICSMEDEIRGKRRKGVLAFYIIEGCTAFAFCWKSQSATGLICIMLLALIWFIRMVIYTWRENIQRILVIVVTSTLILFSPVYGMITWDLITVPEALGTTTVYKNDTFTEKDPVGTVVYASDIGSEIEDSRLWRKITSGSLTTLLAGRNYFYECFIRDLNLFGHKTRPELWGNEDTLAHNGILEVAHRYGIFTMVPYVLMLIFAIVRTLRYGKRKVKFATVPFFVVVSYAAMAMVENLERPFIWLSWIVMYMFMGSVFSEGNMTDSEDVETEDHVLNTKNRCPQ